MGLGLLITLGGFFALQGLLLGGASVAGDIAQADPQAAVYDRQQIAGIAEQIAPGGPGTVWFRNDWITVARAPDGSAVHLITTPSGGLLSGFRPVCAPLLFSASDPTGPLAEKGWKLVSVGQIPVRDPLTAQDAAAICRANAPADQYLQTTIRLVRSN